MSSPRPWADLEKGSHMVHDDDDDDELLEERDASLARNVPPRQRQEREAGTKRAPASAAATAAFDAE